MKYYIGICDDEEMMLKINHVYLTEIAKKLNIKIDIKAFLDSDDLLEVIKTSKIDIVFLDIDLQGESGIKVSSKIKQIKKEIPIVFITGHHEFALNAFDVDAIGYLMKPVEPEKLEKVLKKAISIIKMQKNRVINNSITITENNLKRKIQQYKIIYVEKSGNKCIIYTITSEHFCYDTISNMIKMFDEYFIQISQSTIVNKRYIDKIDGNSITLKNKKEFSIGRKFLIEVRQHYYGEGFH